MEQEAVYVLFEIRCATLDVGWDDAGCAVGETGIHFERHHWACEHDLAIASHPQEYLSPLLLRHARQFDSAMTDHALVL